MRCLNDFDGVENKENCETQMGEKSVAKSFMKSYIHCISLLIHRKQNVFSISCKAALCRIGDHLKRGTFLMGVFLMGVSSHEYGFA